MKKNLLFVAILAMILVSCRREFDYSNFSKPSITVTCLLKADDSVEMNICYTLPIEYDNNYDSLPQSFFIENAEVYLYEDKILVETLNYDIQAEAEGRYGFYRASHYVPQSNKTYQLKIFVPGFDTLFAETYIPQRTNIDSFSISHYSKDIMSYTVIHIDVGLWFADDPIKKNYYSFVSNYLPIYYSNDPIIETGKNGNYVSLSGYADQSISNVCFFSDSLINGKNYNLFMYYEPTDGSLLFLNSFDTISYPYTPLILNTLSKDLYMFYKTAYLNHNAELNPLSEPVVIYSNIKNGAGIFAGYTSATDTLFINKSFLLP